MIFNLVMDRIINHVKGVGLGYRMGQTEFQILCYADDAVLIAESEDNLQRMLFEFNQTANKYNISIPKTKSMTGQGTDPMQAGTKRPTNRTSDEL